jgi:hypothetical protein
LPARSGIADLSRENGGAGGFFPGWSSADGGIEEFPLFRETSLSSRAI